eukprot:14428656-Alexandrium_andersonii.AAC.1
MKTRSSRSLSGLVATRSSAAVAAEAASEARASVCSRSARRPAACRALCPGRFRLAFCSGAAPHATEGGGA